MIVENPFVLTLVASLVFTIMILAIGLLAWMYAKTPKGSTKQEQVINTIVASFNDETYRGKKTGKIPLYQRWNEYWEHSLTGTVKRYDTIPNRAGTDVIILFALIFAITLAVSFNPFVALLVAIFGVFGLTRISVRKSMKRLEKIREQIPGFLFSLKASLQAGATVESALIDVTEYMPSPIKEELEVARNSIMANTSFSESVQKMADESTSPELQFLAACMIQATKSGSGIISQIDNIQRVMQMRREVAQEIHQAVKKAMSTIVGAFVIIPGMFLFSLTQDASNYYFEHPMSYLTTGVAIIIFTGTMLKIRKSINDVKAL